jgi:hypothetical protein
MPALTSRNPFPHTTPLTFEDILPARQFPAFHSSRISLPPRRRGYQRWLISKSSFLFGIGLENIELANGHDRRTHNKVRAAVPPGQGGPALTESTRITAWPLGSQGNTCCTDNGAVTPKLEIPKRRTSLCCHESLCYQVFPRKYIMRERQ